MALYGAVRGTWLCQQIRATFGFKRPPDTGASIETEGTKTGELRIKMVTVLSLSIPVVILHGDTHFTAQLTDLALRPGNEDKVPPQLTLKVHRQPTPSRLYSQSDAS